MAIVLENSQAADPVDAAVAALVEAALASEREYRPAELLGLLAERIPGGGALAEGWFGSPTTPEELEADAADILRSATKESYKDTADRHDDLARASAAIARGEKQLSKMYAEAARARRWHQDNTGIDFYGLPDTEVKRFEAALKKLRKAKEAAARPDSLGRGDYVGD